MATNYFLNQYFTTTLNVGGGIDASQTTGIIVQSVTGLDITKPGIACITYADPINTSTAEWVTYTSIDGSNELQGVTRGAEGFGAKTHSNGAVIAFPVSESHINNLATALSIGGVATNGVTTTLDEDNMASNSATALATQQSIKAYVDTDGGSLGGWTASTDTWVYASASTFTIAGVDRTAIYTKGTRLKFTQTTAKYAVVVSSSFSTDTTVTIAVNTDYTIANAAITAPYYSYQANPQGYPGWFTYTASITGFSANPNLITQFAIVGSQCTLVVTSTTNGTSNATGFSVSLPVAVATITNQNYRAYAFVVDAGTVGDGSCYAASAATAVNFLKAGGATFTNSGNKSGNTQITYKF